MGNTRRGTGRLSRRGGSNFKDDKKYEAAVTHGVLDVLRMDDRKEPGWALMRRVEGV